MARITVPMRTGLGSHKVPERLTLYARRLGLDAKCETAGGWWEKDHLLTAVGDFDAAERFWNFLALNGWVDKR